MSERGKQDNTVIRQVLQRCENALNAGCPILYIRTEASELIRRLVCDRENPPVVLLDRDTMRPLNAEEVQPHRMIRRSRNYIGSYPQTAGGNLPSPDEGKNRYPQMTDMDTHGEMPCLWVYQVPADAGPKLQEQILQSLTMFLDQYEDPAHSQYNALRASAVILYGAEPNLSGYVRERTEMIDVPYPDRAQIREIMIQISENDPVLCGVEEYLEKLTVDFLGCTLLEVEHTMRRIMRLPSRENSVEVEGIIFEQKQKKLKGGLIERCDPDGRIGGMRRFRVWLEDQKNPLQDAEQYLRRIGTDPPKGVLLCGIPGCGKSEAAKFTAQKLQLPLLRMDIGNLLNKYQGVSEQRMRESLNLAETMSPCVLWIDEIEKGFSGANSDDQAAVRRMFGYMLTWMQENRKPCFLFVTANDLGSLPPEFFRSGRFEALFAVYLPTQEECADIFITCLDRAEENIAKSRGEKVEELMAAQRFFSPACREPGFYAEFMEKSCVREDGSPRILIGSDVRKLVDTALRELYKKPPVPEKEWENLPDEEKLRFAEDPEGRLHVRREAWNAVLERVIGSETFAAYGDSEENVQGIAVRYCRMLRTGFIPTGDRPLFHGALYRAGADVPGADAAVKDGGMQDLYTGELLGEEGEAAGKYDQAVFTCLKEKINRIGPGIERWAYEEMIRGNG